MAEGALGNLLPGMAAPAGAAVTHGVPVINPDSPVDIHPALEAVRRMPEYQPPKPGWMEEAMKDPAIRHAVEAAQNAINDFFEHLRRAIQSAVPHGAGDLSGSVLNIISYVLVMILMVLLMFGLYLLLSSLRRLMDRDRGDAAGEAPAPGPAVLVNSEFHKQEAERLAQRGDYEGAVRQMYLATLCLLEENKLVPFDATRTDGEYAEALSALSQLPSAELPAHFAALAGYFERIRYGGRAADAGGFDGYCKDVLVLGQEVATKTPAGKP